MNEQELKRLQKLWQPEKKTNPTAFVFWALMAQVGWCFTLELYRGCVVFVMMIVLLFVIEIAAD